VAIIGNIDLDVRGAQFKSQPDYIYPDLDYSLLGCITVQFVR
jgi:hypothetical protein